MNSDTGQEQVGIRGSCSRILTNRLQNFFESNPLTTTRLSHSSPFCLINSTDPEESFYWLPITHRIDYKIAQLTFKTVYHDAPFYLKDLLQLHKSPWPFDLQAATWTSSHTQNCRPWETMPSVQLPPNLTPFQTIFAFKIGIKTYLFCCASIWHSKLWWFLFKIMITVKNRRMEG